jgi:anti-sigma B factor antagonist
MPVLPSLNLYRHDRGSRTTITLAGEIDLDTAPLVRAMVEDCLRAGIRTIDIDLTVLTFCDVTGLNTFLAAAESTAGAGGALVLHNPRPTVARLFDVTGTAFLLHRLPSAPSLPADVVRLPHAVVAPQLLAS